MLTERQKEALRHDISLCVTAGAGTGKTHVLVNRYISLIENAGCRPSEILALTFTDKAASEMKERVEAEIFEKEGPFWEQIKEEMMWANISTFHSFCTKVLREFPIEAGIDPGYAVLTDNESEEMISGAISSLFNNNPDNRIKDSLSECLSAYGTYYLEIFLRELHRQRRYSKEFFEMLNSDEKSVVERWKHALNEEKEGIASEFKNSDVLPKAAESLLMLAESFSGEGDKGAAYLKSVHDSLRLLNSGNTDDICRGLFGIATISGGAKNMGSKKIFGDYKELLVSSYSALKDYAANLPSDLLALEIEMDKPETKRSLEILKALGVVYSKMEEDIRHDKQIRGAIDFTDMINLTYELFRDHPDIVSRSFRGRYKFIMIDEFQDTDPVQAAITAVLLEDEKPDTQCNRLFVVGDPKQSIYLFRDADVTQFKRSGEVIKNDYNGSMVSLDINFRSTKEVLSFVNRLFSGMLTETEKPWDFGYEPIKVSDKRSDDQGSVELILCPNAEKATERAVIEADAVSKKIRMIKDSGEIHVYPKTAPEGTDRKKQASWGDIAILVERRNNLKYIEYSLKKYGIPYRVHAGLGLYEKQEVFDAVSVLSFLKNPDDDISLYAALRSPWFGFSDAEIFKICGGYAEGLFLKLKKSKDEKAESAVKILSSWLNCARKKLPSEIFRQIVRESGIVAVYSAVPGGEQILANLEKLTDIIREREKGGFYNLDRLISDLKTSVSSNEKTGEAKPADTGEDSVIIMTVHASKGLEFPIVIIPGLSDSPPSDNSSIIIDGELGAGIKIPDFDTGDDYANSPALSVQKYRQKQKSNAEAKRLFYVAATRARDHLIMCGTEPKEIANSREACKTRMDWLTYCLFSGRDDGIREGVCDVRYNETACNIKITRSESMPGFADFDTKSEYLTLPQGIPENSFETKDRMPGELHSNAGKTYSATEIETFIRSPESHRKIFVENREEKPVDRGILQGVDRGRIMHYVFAGEDAESVLERYAPESEENPDDYAEDYRKFQESAFMEDVAESHCELAFLTTIGGYRFSGKIDRLVKKSDGWYIIDYKTGDKKDDDSYLIQMGIYKKAAEDILRSHVRTYIYHTQTGEFTEICLDLKKTESLIVKTCETISGVF